MTTVTIEVSRPDASGLLVPMSGYVKWEPASRNGDTPEGIVAAVPFTVKLVEGAASVQVEPTDGTWAWKVTLQLRAYAHETRYVAVPNTDTVSFTSLVRVDPSTLDPISEPSTGWQVELDRRLEYMTATVVVVTGSEVRPVAASVLWLGGATEPVNMQDGTDVWLQGTA